jgi:membrane fusion protein, multidrug efflux system
MFTKKHWTGSTGFAMLIAAGLLACGDSQQQPAGAAPATPPQLPVVTLDTVTAIVPAAYAATIEGRQNVDIRTQVDGYIDKIYVEEGSFVKAGQPLFKINDQPFREQLNRDQASQRAMEAAVVSAQLEVDKLKPLVENRVVSDIQLKAANAALQSAKANVEQAKAAMQASAINMGFTLIKAPVSGYVGRIPKRIGNLAGKADAAPLTTLSDVSQVYAYFSMSEQAFMEFNPAAKNQRPVKLVLPNGSEYQYKGRIAMVDGQVNRTTGAINLRADFPNPETLLRSGNTGKVVIETVNRAVIEVPQSAIVEQQDMHFVYLLGDSNMVKRQQVSLSGADGKNFIIGQGLQRGQKIITAGLETLAEGQVVAPVEAKSL